MMQLKHLISSLIFGLFLGTCIILKKLISLPSSKKRKSISFIEFIFDILLYLFFGICFALFAYVTDNGSLRWYTFFICVLTSIITFKICYKPLNCMKIKVILLANIFKKHIIAPTLIRLVTVLKFIISPLVKLNRKLKIYVFICKIIHKHKIKYKRKSTFQTLKQI